MTISVLALLFAALSCREKAKPNEGPGGTGGGDKPEPKPELFWECEYFPQAYNFSRKPDKLDIYMKTNIETKDFKLQSTAEWCSYTLTSKEKDLVVLSISVADNSSLDDKGKPLYLPARTATVELTSGSKVDKSIAITQAGFVYFSLEAKPNTELYGYDYYYLPSNGGTRIFRILTNSCGYSAYTEADWLKLSVRPDNSLEVVSTKRAEGLSFRNAEISITDILDSEVTLSFRVREADAEVTGEDYGYGDHSDWD